MKVTLYTSNHIESCTNKKSFTDNSVRFQQPDKKLPQTLFTGADNPSYLTENIQTAKTTFKNLISETFKKDRDAYDVVYTKRYYGEDKFLSPGEYLKSFENDNSRQELFKYVDGLNLQNFSKKYTSFYNTALKSIYDSVYCRQHYSQEFLYQKIGDETLFSVWMDYLNPRYRAIAADDNIFYDEYKRSGNLDKLVKFTLDSYFLSEMNSDEKVLENKNHKMSYSPEINDYKAQKLYEMNKAILDKPLYMKKENIESVFKLINHYLEHSNKTDYLSMYSNLDALSDGIYDGDENKTEEAWKDITGIIKKYYEETVLTQKIDIKAEELKTVKTFVYSNDYKIQNNLFGIDMIFKSDNYSDKEKAFLVNEYQKPYAKDIFRFITEKPANDKLRKQIISNLMLSKKVEEENFHELKEQFIENLINKSYTPLFENKIPDKSGQNQQKIIDRVLEDTPVSAKIHLMSDNDKVEYLKTYHEEEIRLILDKLHNDWTYTKAKEAYETETEKYDINLLMSDVMKNITTTDENGNTINLFDFAKTLSSQLDKIDQKQNKISSGLDDLQQNTDEQFDNTNAILEKLSEQVYINRKLSQDMYILMMKELDKIEAKIPQQKDEVKKVKSTLIKIRDGVINSGTLYQGYIAYSSISGLSSTLTASGEPTLMTAGLLLKAGLFTWGAVRSYKQNANKK